MARSLAFAALLLGALLLGAGCRDEAIGTSPSGTSPSHEADDAQRTPQTVTDALGRRVRLPLPARRAVTLAPNLTEIVFGAGARRRLAGVTTADDFPPAVDTLAKVQAYPQIDFEAVAALRPDLVLATDQVNAPRDATTLTDALGAPTYFFSFSSLKDIFDAVETAGRLLGTQPQAEHAADSLRRTVRRVRRRTARAIRETTEKRPLVLFLIGDETLYTFAKGSYVQEVIRVAGGRSATAGLPTNAPLSEEFVLEAQPDVIVGAFGTDYDPARLARLHPAWRGAVPAIDSGRVYSVEPPLFLRPGPRVVKGVRHLARLLHPSLFAAGPGGSRSGAPLAEAAAAPTAAAAPAAAEAR